jgi:N-sulfoglucosamine sulfohydrolase
MRCLQDKKFGYIYNGWSDGKMQYRSEPMNGLTFPAMRAAAATQPAIAARVEVLLHRTPEELYDLQADPHCLRNLSKEEKHSAQLKQMRSELLAWMEKTNDPLREQYGKVLTGGTATRPE